MVGKKYAYKGVNLGPTPIALALSAVGAEYLISPAQAYVSPAEQEGRRLNYRIPVGVMDEARNGFVANFAERFAALMIVGRTSGGRYDDRIQGQPF